MIELRRISEHYEVIKNIPVVHLSLMTRQVHTRPESKNVFSQSCVRTFKRANEFAADTIQHGESRNNAEF